MCGSSGVPGPVETEPVWIRPHLAALPVPSAGPGPSLWRKLRHPRPEEDTSLENNFLNK